MRCRSYIDGEWLEQSDAPLLDLANPADQREIVSQTVTASPADAVRAVAAAQAAWAGWRQISLQARIELIDNIVNSILGRRDKFADAIVAETGKTHAEALQEVTATAAETQTQIEIFQEGRREIIDDHAIEYEPLGVVLLVTPSNFPLAAVMRKLVPALLAGNTAVVKASELTPMTAVLLFSVIDEQKLPAGVANLILADGRSVVPAMLETTALKAVSMTGSNATGQAIAQKIADRDIRYQAEMGGSNAVVVLADADIELAASDVATHGFACCGQWCTGTTRVIVEQSKFADFVAALRDKVAQYVIGPGKQKGTTIGALISKAQQKRVNDAVRHLVAEGACVELGGGIPSEKRLVFGNFFEPTILVDIGDYASLCDKEIFGPVVAVVAADDFEDALQKNNMGRFGLSCSIYTRDLQQARRFVAAADAGLCHVNLPTGFRDNSLPLSGRKSSGRGMPECGSYAREFFSQTKAVYGLSAAQDSQ